MRTLGVLQVDEHSLKERFEMKHLHQVSYLRDTYGVDKHHHVCLVLCIGCICELPQDITYVYVDYSLSQVADHPMSSPCGVDRAGHVLAYRTMHSNDVTPSSSPISLLHTIAQLFLEITVFG